MKKIVFLCTVVLFVACSSAKRTQEAINSGNYVAAINTAVEKLKDNKSRKGNQDIILLLEEAFQKHTDKEIRNIDRLKKENNPAYFEGIYNAYIDLERIQNKIEPLLPLYIFDEDRDATFDMIDYGNAILKAKTNLAGYLYENANNLLKNAIDKSDYRKAYEDFKYLNQLNPDYKDTRIKIEDAYQKGLDYVNVKLFNDAQVVLPERLEEELLNFNTYGLDNLWTRFHTNEQEAIAYDYEMHLKFNNILVSPEQVATKEILKEKSVKDGWKYELDANGNVKKDSLGNDIKIDNYKTVKCWFFEHTQFKDVQINGTVSYLDLRSKQLLNTYPLTSGFVFEHVHADFKGDTRALDANMIALTKARPLPFPSNEQMIYDSGEDLKNNIKSIVKRHGFY